MEQESRVEDIGRPELESEIEAYLFASDAPLSASRLSSMTGSGSVKEIREAVDSLEGFYRSTDRSFGIVEVAGGYQLVTLPEYSTRIARLFKGRRRARLSRPALETLAIVAYKQPLSRLDIEAIRGVNCDGVLSTLIDRELVAITGRGEGIGKPYLYSTTSKFLEYLGLKDYRELPDMEELEKNLENLELIPRPAEYQEDLEEDDDEDEGEASCAGTAQDEDSEDEGDRELPNAGGPAGDEDGDDTDQE